jgi:streptogramin lyase
MKLRKTGWRWILGFAIAAIVVFTFARHFQSSRSEITGEVINLSDGLPVPQAMVTLTSQANEKGPRTTSVFTDNNGRFRLKLMNATPEPALSVRKLGLEQVYPARIVEASEQSVRIYLQPSADIAKQAPASAWLANAPAGPEKDITIASCSGCHQLVNEKMRAYAIKVEAVRGGPEGDRKAMEEWRKLIRRESWRMVVKYMRAKHYAVFPKGSPMNLDAIDWATTINTGLNFYTESQGETVSAYLAENFKLSAHTLARENYVTGEISGVTSRTRIREFSFPMGALVRELVFAPNSPYLWGADVYRNMIVRLDPRNGSTKWYPVDFKGSTGPHTIVPDKSGRLWVSMIDNDQFGMFDPKTEKWKLWTLRPANLPKGTSMASAAIVHDMSIDDLGHLARDQLGRIWITLVGTNQMGTLNPDNGEVTFNDSNTLPGMSPVNHLIYATVLSADGLCAWYSQVNGHVSCLDTRTMKATKTVRFRNGTSPRRMARDNAGNLWVALFGSGQVARIDMSTGKLVQTIDMPDRGSAPYAVTWDEKRKAVWVVTANSDAVYRIAATTGAVTAYPLPRQMAYLRQISLNHETGQLAASYGNYPAGSGPSMAVVIDVGD